MFLKDSGQIHTINRNNFEFIFRELYPALCKYCIQFMRKPELAEDIVQEVFADVWEKRHELKIVTSVKAYLFKAVKNRSIDFLQSKFARITFDDETTIKNLPGKNDPHEDLEYAELEVIIWVALSELPEKCYIIFSMSRYGNYTNKEIAGILNISTKTVENQITIAIKKVRAFVEKNLSTIPEVVPVYGY